MKYELEIKKPKTVKPLKQLGKSNRLMRRYYKEQTSALRAVFEVKGAI